jgi:hypothetical protein
MYQANVADGTVEKCGLLDEMKMTNKAVWRAQTRSSRRTSTMAENPFMSAGDVGDGLREENDQSTRSMRSKIHRVYA